MAVRQPKGLGGPGAVAPLSSSLARQLHLPWSRVAAQALSGKRTPLPSGLAEQLRVTASVREAQSLVGRGRALPEPQGS